MEFQVPGDKVMLKVSPWKGVMRFGKREKLNPRYVGPFKVLEKVGEVAYKHELPEELRRVFIIQSTWSNLTKMGHADEPLAVLLDGLNLEDKIYFVKEPVEIVACELNCLKLSRIPISQGHGTSNRGPEFTWERKTNSEEISTPLSPRPQHRASNAGIESLEDKALLKRGRVLITPVFSPS
ncbi:hypothetical protein Tco_1163115 [Tanacetum coccineum]